MDFSDMRQYYYTNTDLGGGIMKSELMLLRTNLDDNGTFQCIAENRAGREELNLMSVSSNDSK